MNRRNAVLYLLFFCFCQPIASQLEMDSVYRTADIQSIFDKASLDKDSALIGAAAFQLYQNLRQEKRTRAKSLDLITLSISCFASVGDSLNFYRARMQLIHYYFNAKQFKDVARILLENIAYYDRHEDWKMKVHTLISLGRAYEGLGDIKKSNSYYYQGLALNETVKDTLIEIIACTAQSRNFQLQAQYDSLIIMSKRALVLSEAIDKKHWQALSLFYIGWGYQLKEEYDLGLLAFYKIIAIKKKEVFSTLKKDTYKHISVCLEEKGAYKKAHQYTLHYAALSDSIWEKDRNESLDELTIKYETKEKQTLIQALKEKNEESERQNKQKALLLYALTTLMVLFFFLLWFLIRFYREKIKKDKIISSQTKDINQQKINTLENKMQLAAATAMLEGQEKERTRIAIDLHDSLGGLLSAIKLKIKDSTSNHVEKIEGLLDEATNEVRFISKNLHPKALEEFGLIVALKDLINQYSPFSENPLINFQYYTIPQNIDKVVELQFYRIIQETLNNALKYADAKEILIQINGEEGGVSLLIEDDGSGFDTTQKYAGNGLQNIHKRAAYLDAKLSIKSDAKGTSVFLFCPISVE